MQTATFAELGLSAKVLAAIEATGYATPTPIQAQAIPVALTGRDVLGIAQTGTGKTASFVLPMIARLESGRARARMPRSLILAPTRELAAQCAQSFEKYGVNHKLNVALLIGGVSMGDQVQKLDRGVDVLIATPGRMLDHFQRGKLMLMGVEILVIDEADRMLDMGFIPDIEKICKLLPPRRQTLFFSATMPPEITRLVDQFLKDPVRIEVAKPASAASTITQLFRFCESSEDWDKREALRDILRSLEVRNAIIFSNYKRDVAILLKSLLKHGFNAGALHGDMDQSSRTATLDKFRSGEIALLAASDVAARGLDIPDVSHVINYDVPWQPDDYIHRIGRTGRAGREGCSVTLVTPDDIRSMDSITKLIGTEPVWLGDEPDDDTLAVGRASKRGRGRGAKKGATAGGRRGDVRGRSRRSDGAAPSAPGRDRSVRPERARGAPEVSERRDEGLDTPMRIDEPVRSDDRRPVEPAQDRQARTERPEREPRRPRIVEETGVPHAPVARDEPRQREDEGRRDRNERQDQPARQNRPERQDRPEGRDRAQRRDRPERQARSERSDRPERRDRSEQTERQARPERQDRPQRQSAPVRDEAAEIPFEQTGRDQRPQHQQPRRSDNDPAERVERNTRVAREGRREQPEPRQRDGGGSQQVGLGDHVPAFLRRPVRANAD